MFFGIGIFWKYLEFATLQIFRIVNFLNFLNYKFFEFYKLDIFRIFRIDNLKKCSNWKLLEFSKLKICRILQIWSFSNCPNWKIKKFRVFFQFGKLSKLQKLENFKIVCPFDIPHYSQFCQFSYLPFDINQFRRLNFSTFISYSSGKFVDWKIRKIIKFLKLFKFKN